MTPLKTYGASTITFKDIEMYWLRPNTTTYEVHTFKNNNKRKLLKDIFVYHFLFYICFYS